MKNKNKIVRNITGCLYAFLAIAAGSAIIFMMVGLDRPYEDLPICVSVMRSPIFLVLSVIAAILVTISVLMLSDTTWKENIAIGLGLLISLCALVLIFKGVSFGLLPDGYIAYFTKDLHHADALFHIAAPMMAIFFALLPMIFLLMPLLVIILASYRVNGWRN